jgi:hypothetical protein
MTKDIEKLLEDSEWDNNDWKRHLDFDSDNTESIEILEKLKLEKKYGKDAKRLIGIFFRKMDDEFHRKFNPYNNNKQGLAAKQIVKTFGGYEPAARKALEMMAEYKIDPVHCPRILMPTQMKEKLDQYEEYIRNKGKFKKKIINTKRIE